MASIETSKKGIYFIAVFEAVKGVIALIAGFGILSLMHRDIAEFAEDFVGVLHLNSEGRLAHTIVETITKLDPSNIEIFFALSLVYAAIRFVEAYGLWRLRAWAEWFAIISGAIYVPVEIYEFLQKPTFFRAAVLIFNIAVVIYLYSFRKREKKRRETDEYQIAETKKSA